MRKILFTFFFIIISSDLLSLTNDERQIINTFNNYVTQGWYEKIDNDFLKFN